MDTDTEIKARIDIRVDGRVTTHVDSQMDSQVDGQLVPVLRAGVIVLLPNKPFLRRALADQIYFGFSHRGVHIDMNNLNQLPGDYLMLLTYLENQSQNAGPKWRLTLLQISELTNIPLSDVFIFLEQLEQEQLLDFRTLSKENFLGISFADRVIAEENISQLRSPNSARSEIVNRKDFTIGLINSVSSNSANSTSSSTTSASSSALSSPLLATLYSLLLAAGFTSTYVQQNKSARRILPREVHGLAISASDIGATENETIERLKRSSSLFTQDGTLEAKGKLTNESRFSLVIAAGVPEPHILQKWMSEGVPHLVISSLEESFIEIGPLVIPGESACVNCTQLAQRELHPLAPLIELVRSQRAARDIPGNFIAVIAGSISLLVSEFAATGSSELINRSIRYDARRICNPEHRYWSRSSFCGCSEPV